MKRNALLGILVTLGLSSCSKGTSSKAQGDPPPAAAKQPTTEVPPAAAAPAATPASGDDVTMEFARTLDDDKMKKMLAYEQEMGQHADVVAAGATAQASGAKANDQYTKLAELTNAAMAKAGVTPQDVHRFTTLSTAVYAKDMSAAGARKSLADNEAKAEKWKPIAAQAAKLQGGEQFHFLADHKAERPLEDYEVKMYQDQISKLDADRKTFAAKYGDSVLALLDKYREPFEANLQKQLGAMTGK